jgi:ketosteroid isomerase-like protein
MATKLMLSGSADRLVQESVEDVTRLIREAGEPPTDKFVILTRVRGGKIAVIAEQIGQIIEEEG